MKEKLNEKELEIVRDFLKNLKSRRSVAELRISTLKLRLANGLEKESDVSDTLVQIREEVNSISAGNSQLPEGEIRKTLENRVRGLEFKHCTLEANLERMFERNHLSVPLEILLQTACLDAVIAFEAELRKSVKKEESKTKRKPSGKKAA